MTSIQTTAIALVVALVVGSGGGWVVRGWLADKDLATLQGQYDKAAKTASDEALAQQNKLNADKEALALAISRNAIESATQKRKDDEEIERLRVGLGSGVGRLLVQASCPATQGNVSGTAANGSRTDAGTAELAPAARSTYLVFRAGLKAQHRLLMKCRADLSLRSGTPLSP
jgi:hypothetical protein